jgi:hypothetical protein
MPTLAVQAATTTTAGAVVVAGFEIDGNTPDDPGVTGTDWSSLPDGATHTTDPVGNADTSTFKGSKEFEHPSTWVRGTGLAPNQDDLSDVYFHDEIVGDQIWGYVGFRRYTTSGTTNFDVEFNRLPNSAAKTYQPIRSVGDVMVRFEQDGNSSFRLSAAWFWTRTDGSDWTSGCIEVPGYSPRAGWCPEAVRNVAFTGATGEDGHFGEGAFNFTTLLEEGGIDDLTCEGGAFGTMNIRSFTGNADESALKDYVSPVTIDVGDTCGEMEIVKVDQFGDPVPGATFSIDENPVPGSDPDSPLVVTDGGANDPDKTADGIITIDPATPGTYTVIETKAPEGYELVQPESARTWKVTVGEDGKGSVNVPLLVENRLYFDAPTVRNEATATRNTAYHWKVLKAVDRTAADVAAGAVARFTYTVQLQALPEDPSHHVLVGKVSATNPNEHAMEVTLGITGPGCAYDGAASLDVDPDAGGLQVDLAEGDTVLPYTCAPEGEPATGSTTATMAWDEEDYPSDAQSPAYSASAKADFAYALVASTGGTTTVTDTFNGGAAENLGTYAWNDVWGANPQHTVVVKTYARDLGGTVGTCTSYPNRATESTDGTTADQTVKVCVAAPPEVLPVQSFGKAVGHVRASCQGTVKARLSNRSGETVTYKLRVGAKVHRIVVKSLARKKFVTQGRAMARVTLKVGSTRLDTVRIPQLCEAPEVLPDTGLRAADS